MMRKPARFHVVAALLVLGLGLPSPAGAAGIDLSLDRQVVDVGAFYNGTTVRATGTAPEDAEVVVLVSGKPEDLHLKKKGKAAGLLWMNVGDLTFSNAPRVYQLYATPGAGKLLEAQDMPFSLAALRDRIRIEPADDADRMFREFLKLKQGESVYAVHPEAVRRGPGGRFEVSLDVPPRMKPEDYTVTAFAVRDGRIMASVEGGLTVRQVGFPAWLSKMAFQNALLYGILSVLIAVAAGFLMGALFKGGDGAH